MGHLAKHDVHRLHDISDVRRVVVRVVEVSAFDLATIIAVSDPS